jgi:serine/threonine protein kinase
LIKGLMRHDKHPAGARSASGQPRGLVPGQRVFGRYYLKRALGDGANGVVWLAHDRLLEQPVALKFLAGHLLHDAQAVDRLKHETRRNLKLSHPNIVRIHDFAQGPDGAAIVMEYVDGWSLWAMKVDKPRGIFSVAEVTPWLRDLCSALDYAHTVARIVHRDLKPLNLLLDARGQIKVSDFGLASELWRTRESEPADPRIAGTDLYMSPQQWTGEKPAVADDIYSLGATIYELLTGKPPFYQGDIFKQLHEDTPPSMTDRLFEFGVEDGAVPLAWEETVAACLKKEAAERPSSVAVVAAKLGLG